MTRLARRRHGKKVYLAHVILLAFILLRYDVLFSHLLGNLGWLLVSHPATWSDLGTNGARALSLFEGAIASNPHNASALVGAGVAQVALEDYARAVETWKVGKVDPQVLIRLGIGSASQDDGLAYFRGAAAMHADHPNEGKYLAGQVCQKALPQSDALDLSNECFCRGYFLQNGGNLVLNGQFGEGNTWGWDGQFFFSRPESAAYVIDWSTGRPAPSFAIVGLTEDRHYGLYQRLTLPRDASIRYSAWFKAVGIGEMEARLLYIGWRQDGQTQGNAQFIASTNMNWTYLERSWQLPAGSDPEIDVYPVVLTGQGTVWLDDVRLELMPSQKQPLDPRQG